MKNSPLLSLYYALQKLYGNPGPWPWFGNEKPHTKEEIIIGAVLTQNTSWKNVAYALKNLRNNKANTLKKIYELGKCDMPYLKQLIRPSGFYNQKAERLFALSEYIHKNFSAIQNLFKKDTQELRHILLSLKGIGKETADTIILYAAEKPIFVIDAYTKRFIKTMNKNVPSDIVDSYDAFQKYFETNLPKDTQLFQDFHALMVRWGKENTVKKRSNVRNG